MPHSYFEISFSCTFVYAVAIFKATHVVPRIRALTCYCVLIGNGEQLAKSHNDDNQFSRDMSHNEQLQMMHACFIKHGGKDKSFKVKQLALKEMGVIVEKSTDPMNKKFENSWQLACHTGRKETSGRSRSPWPRRRRTTQRPGPPLQRPGRTSCCRRG